MPIKTHPKRAPLTGMVDRRIKRCVCLQIGDSPGRPKSSLPSGASPSSSSPSNLAAMLFKKQPEKPERPSLGDEEDEALAEQEENADFYESSAEQPESEDDDGPAPEVPQALP